MSETVRELDYNLARALLDGGNPRDAVPLLERVWKQWPREHRFGLHLLHALARCGRVVECRQAFETLQERAAQFAEEAKKELDALALEPEPEKNDSPAKEREEGRRRDHKRRQLMELAAGLPHALLREEKTHTKQAAAPESEPLPSYEFFELCASPAVCEPREPASPILVSGLPRSGTSMLMRMLDAGGIAVLADAERAADENNRLGYFEYAPVKESARDVSWFRDAGGKAVKVVAPILRYLPPRAPARLLVMHRPLDQILASQEAMIGRLGEGKSASAAAGKPAKASVSLLHQVRWAKQSL